MNGEVTWKVEYALGVAEVDAEHFRIVEMIKQLEAARGRSDSFHEVWRIINELIEFLGAHCKHEESLMERAGYPKLAEHRKMHQAFTEHVQEIRSRASVDASEVHQLLLNWQAEHILTVDRDYVKYVQDWMNHEDEAGGRE